MRDVFSTLESLDFDFQPEPWQIIVGHDMDSLKAMNLSIDKNNKLGQAQPELGLE